MRRSYSWKLPRTSLELGRRTALMGILNVTPDSFSDGGRYFERDSAVARGKAIEQEGADILDVGGESTRPGSEPVSEEEELRRVIPVIESLAPVLRIPISVDTYRSSVARAAVDAGAQIINDIGGLRLDSAMADTVSSSKAAVVIMHSRGSRLEIHKQPRTPDVVGAAISDLKRSIDAARAAGVAEAAIMIDPGIGFGKTAEDSAAVLAHLKEFESLNLPLLAGPSRKSFLRDIIPDGPEGRLIGTLATVVLAVANGVHAVRVHDVREMRIATDVADRIVV